MAKNCNLTPKDREPSPVLRNGSSKLIEVVSKSQTVKQMTSKCISMVNANPGASYKVVGWAATISRLFS